MQPQGIDNLTTYFSFTEDNAKFKIHKLSGKKHFFPFSTKMEPKLAVKLKLDLEDFNGVVGEIYRFCNGKQFFTKHRNDNNYKTELKNTLLENIASTTLESNDNQDSQQLSEKLKNIIDSLYFKGDDIVNFSPEAMTLLNFSHHHAGMLNIASFIIFLFLDDYNQGAFKNELDAKPHLLNKLVIKSLPQLDTLQEKRNNGFIVGIPNAIEMFKHDLTLLRKDKRDFLNNINQLIKHYYFYYVSALSIKLNSFFSDEESFALYFTLDSEPYSESRIANQKGWKFLEKRISNLFSHSICLDLLHHIKDLSDTTDYCSINNRYKELNREEQSCLIGNINWITDSYISSGLELKDKTWDEFDIHLQTRSSYVSASSELEKAVIKLWNAIDFQFNYSQRKKPYTGYAAWFKEFCKANVLKNRGRSGYSLNLESDSLLFLIKLSIGDNKKIRLKDLWVQLQKRGLEFDNTSKIAIVEFLEKVNLIEKKSDSGDAQYVKAIL